MYHEQAELAHMTAEQRISYEYSFMSRKDMLNSMREQVEAAREEAERISRAKGEAEGRAEAVRKMLAARLGLEQVCGIMEMTAEEVETIAERRLS